jgi:activator of HSP90 ATPase
MKVLSAQKRGMKERKGMPELRKYTVDLPVSTERAYRAWLDGAEQSHISGGPARIESRPEGKFSTAGGKVTGEIVSLSPFDRIVQTWKSQDGEDAAQVELRFEPTCTGAQLTLRHTGGAHLQQWEINYAHRLQKYLEEMVGEGPVDMDG